MSNLTHGDVCWYVMMSSSRINGRPQPYDKAFTFIYKNTQSHYTTVSARQLLFVWCSLSDDCQTIARCLSDVSPDVCQLSPDICQTSTTYTPDKYHTSDRCVVDAWYMSGGHLVYIWHSICLMGIWYMSGTCLTDVWWELTDVWWDI